MDLAQAVLEDVAEADQHGRLDAPGLEPVDQLLQVDGPIGVLGGMDVDVPLGVDGEVALSPVGHFVQVGRFRTVQRRNILFHFKHLESVAIVGSRSDAGRNQAR